VRATKYLIAAVIFSVALSSQLPATAASAEPAERERYRPRAGVTFNSPGDYGLNNKVLRAIRHTHKGEKIRAMTWNFTGWTFVRALREAHQRGVSVRLIMARSLAHEQGWGGPYRSLKRALQKKNKHRKPERRSWFRVCTNSCRGKGGAMHAKMYVFSKTGAQPRVVMSSSANLTGAAGANQYNDMYTVRGKKTAYRAAKKVFHQASLDRPAKPLVYRTGKIRGWFQPRRGRPDIVMNMLNAVRCKGARGAGIKGRTSIRIAQDVILGERGIRIAQRLRELHRRDCNIRLVYSQLGRKVWRIVQGIPRNHLVRDRDGDGAYDVYLHMKAMAISGHYDGRRDARVVYQGSENWSGLASLSDEQGLVIERDRIERKYGARINKLFKIHLVSTTMVLPRSLRAPNPYVNMEG
jgi:phosphatidylserine/phosphatidylglycerophosphate/cardiolipin synthase-like enzyme